VKSNPLTVKSPIGWLPGPPGARVPGRQLMGFALFVLALILSACGPRLRVPALDAALTGIAPAPDSVVESARSLAPTLYLQPDETFPLLRVVAVQHPTRRIIAYHLLWRDDVHGAWVPFSSPTDQEIIWVGYDDEGRPTRLWTYWHGTIVGTDWTDKGTPAVDVQWGKHAPLPRETLLDDLPWILHPRIYYAFTWALPDLLLGALQRDGPLCFCRGFDRYRQFTIQVPLASRLDLVVVRADPDPILTAVFGERYSRKPPWPWDP